MAAAEGPSIGSTQLPSVAACSPAVPFLTHDLQRVNRLSKVVHQRGDDVGQVLEIITRKPTKEMVVDPQSLRGDILYFLLTQLG